MGLVKGRKRYHDSTSLSGSLLIASPTIMGNQFQRSLIYIVSHSTAGAMGLVVNKIVKSVSFPALLSQMDVRANALNANDDIKIYHGGPMDTERGFVLHSTDYKQKSTLRTSSGIYLTATIDILKDIAHGRGPRQNLLALGYAGWQPGQLEDEVRGNAWLTTEGDPDLVFASGGMKWDHAIARIGFDLAQLSSISGRA